MIHAAKCIKLSYVVYCILVIRYNFNFVCFITCFSCNWTSLQLHIEVHVDIHNELSFQMFRIPLVQIGTICPLHYLLIVTLMHVYNYYQLFACLLTSMLYQYTPVQALLWTGGAIWLHALAIKALLNKILISQLHLHYRRNPQEILWY